jgi:hypothetical protein
MAPHLPEELPQEHICTREGVMISLALEYAIVYAIVCMAARHEPAFIRGTIALAVSTLPRILSMLVAAAIAAVGPSRGGAVIALPLLFLIPVATLRVYLSYAWARCAFYGALSVGVAVLSDTAMVAMRG